jgi:hypothetical protein
MHSPVTAQCPTCHALLERKSEFCGHCGRYIGSLSYDTVPLETERMEALRPVSPPAALPPLVIHPGSSQRGSSGSSQDDDDTQQQTEPTRSSQPDNSFRAYRAANTCTAAEAHAQSDNAAKLYTHALPQPNTYPCIVTYS